jgi:peptidoglycan/xylan/chitin deacetylase (PgdA/CDA1 family)
MVELICPYMSIFARHVLQLTFVMRKVVYLTIDDCPSQHFIEKVNFLLDNNIPAVLFCQGDLLQNNWDVIRYAIKKGFLIGNHSNTHAHFSMLSLQRCLEEITKTDELIKSLYLQEGVTFYPKLFRFPYGDCGDFRFGYFNYPPYYQWASLIKHMRINVLRGFIKLPETCKASSAPLSYIKCRKSTIQMHLCALGYKQPTLPDVHYKFYQNLSHRYDWSWTFDAMDWSTGSRADILKRLTACNPADPRGKILEEHGLSFNGSADVVLLHDHVSTTDLFFDIIGYMLKKEVVFKKPFDSCF